MVPPPANVPPTSLLSIFILFIVVLIGGFLTGFICMCGFDQYGCYCDEQKSGMGITLIILLLAWMAFRVIKNIIVFLWSTLKK